ncbi:unnamed protein product [Musa acuminata subsp. burmannicoides]
MAVPPLIPLLTLASVSQSLPPPTTATFCSPATSSAPTSSSPTVPPPSSCNLPRRLHRVAHPVPPMGQLEEVRGSAPTRRRGGHLRPRRVVDPRLRLRRRPRPRGVDARPSRGEERAVLVGDALRERQAGDQGLQPPHEG